MNIPPYYKKLMNKSHKYIESGEPLAFVGMYDCGKNYLFRLLVAEEEKRVEPVIKVAVELTGTQGSLEQTLYAVSLGLSLVKKIPEPLLSLEKILEVVRQLSKEGKIAFICNVGYQEPFNGDLLKALYKWRNLIGLRFNWIICVNYGVMLSPFKETLEFEKVISTRLVPILPLDTANARNVLETNQERYGKIPEEKIQKIIRLSGGNPGLLKSLLFLALQNSIDKWKEDEKILSRLRRILGELADDDVNILKQLAQHEKLDIPTHLEFFGYVNEKNEVFSPLVAEYTRSLYHKEREKVPIISEEIGIELTPSERKIFTLLKETSGKIVSRDEIAKTLWGDDWSERYSDWAIDQLIHSIREKLSKEKNIGKIKTKKGEGFVFTP